MPGSRQRNAQLLDRLREVRWAQQQLQQEEEALVHQARAAGISGARVAQELGRSRQVLHAQYSVTDVGWRDLDDTELAVHHAHARSYSNGPSQQGRVHLEVAGEDHVDAYTYDGRTRAWDADPRCALPAELVARLEIAGDEAQSRAERRYAGSLKRAATIEAGNIKVGRPPRRR